METELADNLAPPGGNRRVVATRPDGPVDLRRDVVDGTFLNPGHGVAVDIVVGPTRTGRGGGDAVFLGDGGIGAPYAGGRDAEPHVGFLRLNHLIYLGNELVDILPAPVAPREVVGVLGLVEIVVHGIGRARHVEVVVEYDTVDVVVVYYLLDDGCNVVAHLLHRGVEDRAATRVVEQPVGVRFAIVEGCAVPLVEHTLVAVGVEPGVNLDAAFVTFLNDKLEGVVSRVHAPGGYQVARPGLVGRAIHRIAAASHLEIDGVAVGSLHRVEQHGELVFLLLYLLGVAGLGNHGRLGPGEAPHGR